MKRYVIVSTNNNPDYFFYAKYQEKAWNSLGWGLCIMITHDVNVDDIRINNPSTIIIRLPHIEGLRTESIAQAGRLYAANYFDEDVLLMTCDMDLIPLSNYWNPNENDVTVYGHDLTDYTYYPMGYTAMKASEWKKYMNLTGGTKFDIIRDAYEYKHLAYAPDWESWWNFDWRMLTDKLMPFKENIKFINRGRQPNGFAYGRIDRGNSMAHVEGELIDMHCENNNVQHPDKLNKFLEVFEKVYGKI